jgi:DNA-binding transcriptional regulator YbjK
VSQVRAPRQARSQHRRDALLQAAVELLAEGGIQAVTHRTVAARAGLPPSTTGYFFPSIYDLAAEALRVYTTAGIEEFVELADASTRHQAAGADALIDAVAHHQADPQLALAQASVYLEATRTPQLREPVAEAVEAYRQLTEQLLRAVGVPCAESASAAFQALLDGFMLHRLAKPDDPPSPDVVVDALESLLVGCLLDEDQRQVVKERLGGPTPSSE